MDAELGAPESWRDRQPTDKEVKAVTTLQAGFKGHMVREIFSALKPGRQPVHTQKMYLFMHHGQVLSFI